MSWYDINNISWLNWQLQVGGWVYHHWIESTPKPPPLQNPLVPEAGVGQRVPMIYGNVSVTAPNLVWSGNYLAPDESYASASGPATADHFSIDLVFILGVPFYGGACEVTALLLGDTAILTRTIGSTIGTRQLFAFGPSPPSSSEFSINGVLYTGNTTQDLFDNTQLGTITSAVYDDGVSYNGGAAGTGTAYKQMIGFSGEDATLKPSFRSQAVAVLHFGLGQSTDVPSLVFHVKSKSVGTPADMGHELISGGGGADPAAVIFDLLTGGFGKLAIPTSKIDIPSFQAASLTLFNESHGFSAFINSSTDAQTLIAQILKEIDGLIYQEPTTGKLVLKLIRADYNPATVPNINPDNVVELPSGWYSIPSPAEAYNQVRVQFTIPGLPSGSGIAYGQNQAAIIAQSGKPRCLDLQMPGITDQTVAQHVASRELAVVSHQLAKCQLSVNRTLSSLRPGDVVTLTWPELGISGMIFRILSVDIGKLDDGKIGLGMLRDVFDVGVGAYPVPT